MEWFSYHQRGTNQNSLLTWDAIMLPWSIFNIVFEIKGYIREGNLERWLSENSSRLIGCLLYFESSFHRVKSMSEILEKDMASAAISNLQSRFSLYDLNVTGITIRFLSVMRTLYPSWLERSRLFENNASLQTIILKLSRSRAGMQCWYHIVLHNLWSSWVA